MKCPDCGAMIEPDAEGGETMPDSEVPTIPAKKAPMKAAGMMKPFPKIQPKKKGKKVISKITHKGDPFFGGKA